MAKAQPQRFYYDACALDTKGLSEIVNRPRANDSIVSHLSLGEAYGVSLAKGPNVARVFVELVERIRDHIKIVSNEGINDLLEEVMIEFPVLDAADAVHLATAINQECIHMRSSDRDLNGIPTSKLTKFCQDQNKAKITISAL